jgi:tRNA G18 (ribose-2'-O)-methylase SpoU
MAVVSSCSNVCSTRSTGLGTTTTAIVVDAYIVKNTNKHRNVINRGRIKSTTSSALLSRIITSNNMHSLNNGSIGRIRQRSNTHHQFMSLTVMLTSENDDDDDYGGNNVDAEKENAIETGTATANYMEDLLQSKLDGYLNRDEVSNIVRHQPKAMNLQKSILSSQKEIVIKQIETATIVLDWFLLSSCCTSTTTGSTLFTLSQVATILKDHPPILSYGIENNIIPTIQFYNDSLRKIFSQQQSTTTTTSSSSNGSTNNNNENIIAIDIDPRTVRFLCENPKLFEFNIKKRMKPRFDAYQKIIIAAAAAAEMVIDNHQDKSRCSAEDTLKIIATKTDSRFEEWLQEVKRRAFQEEEEIIEDDEAVVVMDNTNTNILSEEEQQHYDDDVHVQPSYSSYVILSNLQSGMNIGNILRSASIFGCTECIVVGQKRHRLTGDHGSRFDLPRRHFYTHVEAKEYLSKQQQQQQQQGKGKGNKTNTNTNAVKIYGVEIMDNASPLMKYDAETGVVTFPFGDRKQHEASNGAAFVMGNEGLGLSEKQKEICDEFIYIPQRRGGSGGTSSATSSRDANGNGRGSASLNVSCAAAIILHAYSLWADYPVAAIEGEKFVAT